MVLPSRQLLHLLAIGWLSCAIALPQYSYSTRSEDFTDDDIFTRDVCVIGGGSGGTYAALGLKDRGKSVIVIEKEDRLGGHTNTYTDPKTGYTLDYGVQIYDNVPIVKKYYGRFGIPLAVFQLNGVGPGVTQNVDFATGMLQTFIPSDPTQALEAYGAQLAKYPYIRPGYNLPDPVPTDLLLPFGDFVKKYNLDAAVLTVQLIAQGIGDMLKVPTLYVLKYFSATVLQSEFTGYLVTVRHDNSEIYDLALQELGAGKNALLESHVVSMDRDSHAEYPINVVVATPTGHKLVKAKKLVVAIPQKLDNLEGFDLDGRERDIFGEFKNAYYWTVLINNTGIPPGYTFNNAGANIPYHLPAQPGAYGIGASPIADLFNVYYGSPTFQSDDTVKDAIIDAVLKLKNDGISTVQKPNFVEFKNHSPFVLQVSADKIEDGFYNKLYGLQGYRDTWYTGAAFAAQDSSAVWNFTENLLPSIVA